jgi:hypothetical protein
MAWVIGQGNFTARMQKRKWCRRVTIKILPTCQPNIGVADADTSRFPLIQGLPLTVMFEANTKHGPEDVRATDSADSTDKKTMCGRSISEKSRFRDFQVAMKPTTRFGPKKNTQFNG